MSTNVKTQDVDENSVLNFVRKMIKLRKDSKNVLVYGKYTLLDKRNKNVYAYTREANGKTMLVLLNFSKNESNYTTDLDLAKAKILIHNYPEASASGILKPYEAIIYEF